jgi:hypothetical protein
LHEALLHRLESANLLFDVCDLRVGTFPNVCGGTARPDTQAEQLFDLLQRESEFLCTLNEMDQQSRCDTQSVFAMAAAEAADVRNSGSSPR